MKMNFQFPLIVMALFCLAACNSSAPETDTDSASTPATEKFGGLALYTVRDSMDSNPKQTLKKVADIGYQYIEAAGYEDGKFYGMKPEEFRNYLNEIGLIPVSSHHGSVTLDNADQMIADAKAVGFKYFVIPIPPMGHFKYDAATNTLSMSDEVEEVTNIINTIGKKCTDAGLECLYHNHNFEFMENGKGIVPMDYFIEHTDPANVNFELDLYWATKAGADPIAYFEKAPGRFKAWHLKDMDPQERFAPVGTGSIDFAKILAKKDVSGMEYYFVEQDATFERKPLEAIVVSHNALKGIGFQ